MVENQCETNCECMEIQRSSIHNNDTNECCCQTTTNKTNSSIGECCSSDPISEAKSL